MSLSDLEPTCLSVLCFELCHGFLKDTWICVTEDILAHFLCNVSFLLLFPFLIHNTRASIMRNGKKAGGMVKARTSSRQVVPMVPVK